MAETRRGKLLWSLRATGDTVECAPLEPLRYVERELVSPNGTVVKVSVPVYPLPLASQAAEKISRSTGPRPALNESS